MAKPLYSKIEQHVIDIVRKKRLEKGWSQKELSDQLGNKSRGNISDAENPKHKRKYNLKDINDLAKVFECSPKDFLPDKPL